MLLNIDVKLTLLTELNHMEKKILNYNSKIVHSRLKKSLFEFFFS
jgi:hypothetical protein